VLELNDGRVFERYSRPQRIDDSVSGRVWSFRDVTEQKRMEVTLKESEALHRSILNASPDIITITDLKGRIMMVSPIGLTMFGHKEGDDVLGRSIIDYLVPEERERALANIRLLFQGNFRGPDEYRAIRIDDNMMDVEVNADLIRGMDGHPNGLIIVIRDITERKRLERALRDGEEKFREIFNRANDAIRVHEVSEEGTPGRFLDANEMASRMLGYTREEMLQMQPCDITTGYYDPPLPKVFETLRATGCTKFETEHRHKNGSIVPVEINSHIVNLQGKRMTIEVVRDISENKRNMNALRTANVKLNLLSSITRHDIKNQLMTLTGHMMLIDGNQNDVGQHLQKAETAANHISAMIQFTKTYEDIGVYAPAWQSVRELVDKCSKEVHMGTIRVVNDVSAGIEIFADPLIIKVFYNLIDNAVRHGGKTSTIRFYSEERNGMRTIFCEDDGVGIPEEMKENLFMKGFGKDHGLGLIISREILAITGIKICEIGEHGHGAKFRMTISDHGLRGTASLTIN
jgi:PAS domain S-box-containing protein